MMWNYLFKVVYWNDSLGEHGAEDTDYCAVQAQNAAVAVEHLEDWYGEDLIDFECRIVEYQPVKLTAELYDKLWREL